MNVFYLMTLTETTTSQSANKGHRNAYTFSIGVRSETDLPAVRLTVAFDHERLFATENKIPDFGQRNMDFQRHTWRTITIARRLTFAI
jgi:hypothetical protein